MANRSWQNAGHFYAPHTMPILIDCNFAVSVADSAGKGITGLKGPGVSAVYMNTSTTPSTYNPNPAAGEIVVKLQDNYNKYFCHWGSIIGPNGAATTSSKANVLNIITVLGTATTAQWNTVGLPVGVTPAVGVVFVGTVAAVIGGSAQTAIALAAGAGIDHIETVGLPNLDLSPAGVSAAAGSLAGQGSLLYFRCLKNGVLTAPTDLSVISLSIYLSNSSVTVSGE